DALSLMCCLAPPTFSSYRPCSNPHRCPTRRSSHLQKLASLYRLGVRYMTLTWNNGNDWAGSSTDPERHGGLTSFRSGSVDEPAQNRKSTRLNSSHGRL